jgi:2-keto-4-pentenoate hydratase
MTQVWDDDRVQRGMAAQMALREQRLSGGETPVGWKIGFGTPAQQERWSIDGAVVGFLTHSGFSEGDPCSVTGWKRPLIEPEIAVHLGADLGPGSDREAVAAAIRGLGPAIELLDPDAALDELDAILATNVHNRGVMLGPVDESRAVGDTADIRVRVYRGDEQIGAEDDPIAVVGDLVELTRQVADLLDASGSRLRAGDAIITGSIIPKLGVAAGDAIRCDFGPLGELRATFTD